LKLSNPVAIVVGHGGQDGTLLTDLLVGRGYQVLGIGRSRVDRIGFHDVPVPAVNIFDSDSVHSFIKECKPREVYFLAAHHSSSDRASLDKLDIVSNISMSYQVHVQAPLNFLSALQRCHPDGRFFYASSSLIFGDGDPSRRLDENSPHCPKGEYALTKCLGGLACKTFRQKHGLFASVGILFNHESHLRAETYLSQRIVRAVARIAAGDEQPLVLGDLSAIVDWGYAPDFVDAFHRIMQLPQSDDFIIATGQPHTVEDFARIAFAQAGLDWREHVRVDSQLLGRQQVGRIGNIERLARLTGWRPSMTFESMVQLLTDQSIAGRSS
jgi:GDPmannose 4,6-dehydratase